MIRPNETHQITWQGITIEISYCKKWLSTNIDGYNIAHLEIKTIKPERARLPITVTGYRSHFCHHEDIEQYGGAIEFVIAWLESKARSCEWQTYLDQSRQPDLFEL